MTIIIIIYYYAGCYLFLSIWLVSKECWFCHKWNLHDRVMISWHGDQAGSTAFSWHDCHSCTLGSKIRDDTLSCLCTLSRAAWRAWKEAGRPTEGPLYEKKCDMRRQVRKWVNYCAALAEREFKGGRRIHGRPSGGQFVVDGKVISNPEHLSAWVYHVHNKHSISP